MLPDPAVLRSAASTCDAAAGDVNGSRGGTWLQALDTHWAAAAAERIKSELADHDALARTGSDELRAVATHLRRLAVAIETLKDRMRVAHDRRTLSLQGELTTARGGEARSSELSRLHSDLWAVPDPTDPFWATQVDVPSVPLPEVSRANRIPLGPIGPPTGVSVDTAAVRRLSESVAALSRTLAEARERAASVVAGLPLGQLDRYGLPGSVAGGFLSDVTGGDVSALAAAARGYDLAARRTAALADMVERADVAGMPVADLLGDSRASRAVDLTALLTTGADAGQMWTAVDAVSEEDLAWLMRVVPELEAALGAQTEEDGLPISWVDGLDWLTGITGAPISVAERATDMAAARGADARRIKPVAGSTQAQRSAYKAAIQLMRSSRGEAARFTALAARIPGSGPLARLNRPIARATPVLSKVPGLSVLMTGFGTAVDMNNGMSPEGAVVKNVASTAAGLGAVALTTGLLAGTAIAGTAAAPVLIAVGVGAAVSYGTGKLIEHYGDDILDFGGGAVDRGRDVIDWAFG